MESLSRVLEFEESRSQFELRTNYNLHYLEMFALALVIHVWRCYTGIQPPDVWRLVEVVLIGLIFLSSVQSWSLFRVALHWRQPLSCVRRPTSNNILRSCRDGDDVLEEQSCCWSQNGASCDWFLSISPTFFQEV